METEQNLPAEPNYAGFWARVSAYFLDGAIIAFITLNALWLIREQLTYYLAVHPEALKMFHADSETSSYSDSYNIENKIMYYIAATFSWIFGWIYFAGFESSYLRATPGKWILGLYVTDMGEKRISFGNATGRYFGKIVSGLILCIGYMMAGFTDKKQALHDSMAGCLVLKK